MSANRREFLTTAAAVTGLGTLSLPLAAQGVVNMPTPRASALMALFGLKYPIFSAGMGTTAIPELAIAVSNAGGLGAIPGALGRLRLGPGSKWRISCASASCGSNPQPIAPSR
jgi:Nitronate monooxygenase